MTERGGDGGVPDRAQMRTEAAFDGHEPTIAGRSTERRICKRRDERAQPTATRARVCVHEDEDLACGIARTQARAQVVYLLPAIARRSCDDDARDDCARR